VSHQAVRCGFIFLSHSGSLAIKNKAADDRLKAHPKGANQRRPALRYHYGFTAMPCSERVGLRSPINIILLEY